MKTKIALAVVALAGYAQIGNAACLTSSQYTRAANAVVNNFKAVWAAEDARLNAGLTAENARYQKAMEAVPNDLDQSSRPMNGNEHRHFHIVKNLTDYRNTAVQAAYNKQVADLATLWASLCK